MRALLGFIGRILFQRTAEGLPILKVPRSLTARYSALLYIRSDNGGHLHHIDCLAFLHLG